MAAKRISSLFSSSGPDHSASMPSDTSSAAHAPNEPPRRASPPGAAARSRSPAPTRLQKAPPASAHPRVPSGQFLATGTDPSQPSLHDIKHQFAAQDNAAMPSPPLPPPTFGNFSRPSSRDRSSRPGTPGSLAGSAAGSGGSRPGTPSLAVPHQSTMTTPASPAGKTSDKEKKKSWFGKSKKDKDEPRGPFAWIAGHPQRQAFDTIPLLQGKRVNDLWDEADGNCYVYLFPKNSGKGASFKVDSSIFASSPPLTRLAFGDVYSGGMNGDRRDMPLDARTKNLSLGSPPRRDNTTSSGSSHGSRGGRSTFSDAEEAHLHLPLKLNGDGADSKALLDDLQTLIDFYNFFAFLCGQALVATEKRSSFFHIFMMVASILKSNEFSNLDGSTYGEVASGSFDAYVEELGLADVRASREKTIEGVVLGERMKSIMLYNEAFTHAAGKLEDLTGLNSPKFGLISSVTQTRLTRAAMDLEKRIESVRLTLSDFDIPSLFSGIMSSKMAEERKEGVRFDAWKDTYLGMRKWMLSMLKQRYGDWPPKAKSKKNDLETSGLQRIVLRDLYFDLCSLYDLLVDRTQLTTRTVDGIDLSSTKESPTVRGLRSALSEYDRSTPPVKPPIPFDLPLLPDLKTTRPDFNTGDKKKDARALSKKLKDDEITYLLRSCWNGDARATPFVSAFQDMEKRAAHHSTVAELTDQRIGAFIFMYSVLQALPMLACDAPGLKFTQSVEYFLCEPPRSGVPWADPEKASAGRRNWYAVGEAGGVVSLPSDVVEHGVEGIYRRSHAWTQAERWTAANPILNEALHEQAHASSAPQVQEPRPNSFGAPPSRSGSPSQHSLRAPSPASGFLAPGTISREGSPSSFSRSAKRNSSLGIGLEALPLPAGVAPDGGLGYGEGGDGERPKSVHQVDEKKTFDAILAGVEPKKKKRYALG